VIVERGAQPPATAVAQADVRAALKAHEDAVAGVRTADRAYVLLERSGLARAEALDAQATADAAANGSKDPGAKNVAKYQVQLSDAKRQASAAKITEARAWESVQEAFAAHSAELQETAEQEIERSRRSYLEAIDQLQVMHDELVKALAWRQFFAANGDLMGAGTYRAAQPPFSTTVAAPPVHTLDDTRASTRDLLESLRTLGAPEPPRAGMNPQAYAEGEDFSGQLPPPRHIPPGKQGVEMGISAPGGPVTWPMPRVPG
jgi:hypothetical protein